ncbi:TIGR03085 family metal-binding protein [Nesterenkonia sp. AY15]|uniref:TIGR03085 family metal-binding protein n=1 Tax=Nesterenkonia sp. AY15 TaxID=2901139 RepID=UPI001F4CD78F|nr:TIGR03085 family metal-binding protein [Nesterenkonia sp. AY15]MCH8570235.1 TIGR03085 family metal-binding protein [Nesterenkonia sp. AY15]
MTSTASEQRQALVTALRSVPADAPTLCEGWAAEDLALHIVIRDSRPDLIIGPALPLVGDAARRTLDKLRATGYESLVNRAEAGPPLYFPQSLPPLNDLMNTAEFYIHTEDVLRAQSDFDPKSPRRISEKLRRRLWKQGATAMFAMAARKAKRRITFISPGYGATTSGPSSAPVQEIQGAPEELLLWAFGREEKAQVSISEG